MACEAVKRGYAKRRGKSSIEFFHCGRPYRYCFGYVDKATDELIMPCALCNSHVRYAQDDYDALLNGHKDGGKPSFHLTTFQTEETTHD